jgi:hypothetical protein
MLDEMVSHVEWLNQDEEDTEGEEEDEDDDTDEEEPAPLSRERSGVTSRTELSTLTTEVRGDLFDLAERYGILFRGPKPTIPENIRKREDKIRKKIAEKEAKKGVAET